MKTIIIIGATRTDAQNDPQAKHSTALIHKRRQSDESSRREKRLIYSRADEFFIRRKRHGSGASGVKKSDALDLQASRHQASMGGKKKTGERARAHISSRMTDEDIASVSPAVAANRVCTYPGRVSCGPHIVIINAGIGLVAMSLA